MARSQSSSRQRRVGPSSRGHPTGPSSAPRRSGFTPHGLSLLYQFALPNLRRAEKRTFFNTMARWVVVWFAFAGTLLGYSWAGPFGAILGLVVALRAGIKFVVRERFYRR